MECSEANTNIRKILKRIDEAADSVDKLWFQKGNLGYPVFKTPLGNIRMLICAGGRIPEVARCEALNGEVLLDLANCGSRDQYLYNALFEE